MLATSINTLHFVTVGRWRECKRYGFFVFHKRLRTGRDLCVEVVVLFLRLYHVSQMRTAVILQ